MRPYPAFTTATLGAYSVPRWYETLETLVRSGQLSNADMADAQFRASQGALCDQEAAGIDIVTGGEMHRCTNNRHAPLRAMLNFFWAKIPAFSGATRPRAITAHDPAIAHPAAVCRSKIADDGDLGLVDEFRTVSTFARRPVKITMTGPHMLAKIAYDEHYGDLAAMMADIGKLLNRNLRRLADAGCTDIQIDETFFCSSDDHEVRKAVDAINIALEDLPGNVHVAMHVCQGNYAVGYDYDGQLGHRYFDGSRYPAELAAGIACTSFLVENDMVAEYEGKLGNRQLGVGAVDVQDVNVESGETVAERIRAYRWLAPEQTLVTSSCGMNHLPRYIAYGKLCAMREAKRILSSGVAVPA